MDALERPAGLVPLSDPTRPQVALVGCGRWGSNIARVLEQAGALAHVIDPAWGGLSFDAATGPAVDAVIVATPAVSHAEIAMRALAAGKHVLVEKPFAMSVTDARQCVDLARQQGLVLMAGHLLQYHAAFVRMKEAVRSGMIGELRHIGCVRAGPGRIRASENVLWSLAPHDVSMILSLTGREPEAVRAQHSCIVRPDVADVASIHMSFGRVTADLFVSWLSPLKRCELIATGTEGVLIFDDAARRKLMFYPGLTTTNGAEVEFNRSEGVALAYAPGEPLAFEVSAFLDAVRTGIAPITDGAEAMAVTRVLCAAEASL